MADQITLFDLPSNGGTAWSLNPWKIRAALNFKSIPYKTQWVEYPDIKPLFSSFDLPPNDPSAHPAQYTIPAVQLPDGRYVMDSSNIVGELEVLKPLPSLRLQGDQVERVKQALGKAWNPLIPEVMPRIPAHLNKRSADYFEETREKRFGMPLAELAKSDKAGETAWAAAQEGLEALKDVLTENGAGPYVEGATPGYADIILAGFLEFARTVAPDIFERVTGYDESLKNHYEATKPWLERNDH